MINIGTKVKLIVNNSEVAGRVVNVDNNDVALVEIMRMHNWHYHCPLTQLKEMTEQEEKQFYSGSKK